MTTMYNPKIITDWTVLQESIKNFLPHGENKRLVFTNGCFDILHPGHVDLLSRAATFGDILIVGINSDYSVRQIKGNPTANIIPRPVVAEAERAFVLAGLKSVDFVTFFDQETPLELILRLKPDVLIKGGDWPVEQIVGAREVLSWGGKTYSLPLLSGFSTTKIIRKILNEHNKPANAL